VPRTVTVTLTDEVAELLDAIAFVDGHKKRAGAARWAVYRFALDRKDDPAVRALIGAREEYQARRGTRRRGHLGVIDGGAA